MPLLFLCPISSGGMDIEEAGDDIALKETKPTIRIKCGRNERRCGADAPCQGRNQRLELLAVGGDDEATEGFCSVFKEAKHTKNRPL